eukprot:1673183-Amphidinium_carterae.1
MVVLIPWMKYYMATNSWIYNLEERFVQQISTSVADLPLEEVSLTSRRIISRIKQEEGLRFKQDMWQFAPHYPYPPKGRDYALGLQAGGNGLFGTFLVVHTTHALEVGSTKLRDPDWFVLSNSVELPCYRVMLWYNNPYHQFTGFVEASTTTGAPSQLDKKNGGEHPMWLVAARSPMLSKRDGFTGPGSVDGFFDRWLPNFVDEAGSTQFAPPPSLDIEDVKCDSYPIWKMRVAQRSRKMPMQKLYRLQLAATYFRG